MIRKETIKIEDRPSRENGWPIGVEVDLGWVVVPGFCEFEIEISPIPTA